MCAIADIIFENQIVAREIRNKNESIVFGNENLTLKNLSQVFPHYRFSTLHQQHTNEIVEALERDIEPLADGQFSRESFVGLVIKTADCLPIFLSDGTTVVALHAGWKGVENGIVKRAKSFFANSAATYYIGPHIQASHFEFSLERAKELIKNVGYPQIDIEKILIPFSDTKGLLNLTALAEFQLQSWARKGYVCETNTLTDPVYHSHRRNSQNKKRNLSFIVRTHN